MKDFATIEDINNLFRTLSPNEIERATALLPAVSSCIRQEAMNVGKNIDKMLEKEQLLPEVLKAITVDIVARTLLTSTKDEPMTQMSQSALGYTVSGTYLVPGGGIFIKKSELARLGLRKQRYGVIDFYGND